MSELDPVHIDDSHPCVPCFEKLLAERDRLKAELESCDKYAKGQYKAYDEEIAHLKVRMSVTCPSQMELEKDRDLWKSKAEKLAEALRRIGHSDECTSANNCCAEDCICAYDGLKEALDDYERGE